METTLFDIAIILVVILIWVIISGYLVKAEITELIRKIDEFERKWRDR